MASNLRYIIRNHWLPKQKKNFDETHNYDLYPAPNLDFVRILDHCFEGWYTASLNHNRHVNAQSYTSVHLVGCDYERCFLSLSLSFTFNHELKWTEATHEINPFRGSFYQHEYVITCSVKCGMKLLIHSKTSTAHTLAWNFCQKYTHRWWIWVQKVTHVSAMCTPRLKDPRSKFNRNYFATDTIDRIVMSIVIWKHLTRDKIR